MHRSILFFVIGFSVIGFGEPDRINAFGEGRYLGNGWYSTTSGASGSYSSYVEIKNDSWVLHYFRFNILQSFQVDINFTGLGFFTANAFIKPSNGEDNVFMGEGYCGRSQCHLNIDLGQGWLEETITFSPFEKRLFRLGSMEYVDARGQEQLLSWDEELALIPPELPNEQ